MTTPTPLASPLTSLTCPCGHAPERHDEIAARWCQATIVGGLQRGCVCPAA
ncbi:MAG TPA: RGCVC family protein [Sporichthyaceae bacterium]|nr:RGCVC family protein [Sporichthyaceae bacterium]